MNPIKTIGHSNHPIERFVDLLKAGGVETLVDVRSTPYSRRFPQFGRERLARTLADSGIDYLFAGAALGGKSGASYDASAARPEFRDALSDLIARSADRTLCLMCKSGPDLYSTDRATQLAEAYAARERKMKGGS
jgi:uncharacterized protein (DUF488 family)